MINANSKPWLAIYRGRWLGWGIILVLLGLWWLTEVAQAQPVPPAPISFAISQQIIAPDPNAPVALNDSISFIIVITNTGTTEISSLPLTYTFASQYLTLNSISPPPDSDNGAGQLHWNNFVPSCGVPLTPQATCTIYLDFKATQDTTLLPDQRTVTTAQIGNQQSGAGVRIDGSVYIVEQQPIIKFVTPGSAITITITISNTGVEVITGLPLIYTYDAQHLIFTGATLPPDQGSAGQLKWNDLASCGGVLAPKATCTVVVAFVTLSDPRQDGQGANVTAQSRSHQSAATVVIGSPTQTQNPFETRPVWVDNTPATATSLAWGDVDGDGDLDLAVGYIDANQPLRVYLNQAGHLQTEKPWQSSAGNAVASLAWGDMDNDGDLDLVVGNQGQDKVYLNQNGQLATIPAWISSDNDATKSIALGDVDGDGDLDLAVGNYGENKIYLFAVDAQGQLMATLGWHAGVDYATTSIALGDADDDGDLDLAVGVGTASSSAISNPQPLRIYLFTKNVQNNLAVQQELTIDAVRNITSLAWGDSDGDGDLDLAVGAYGTGIMLYLNQTKNQQLVLTHTWTSEWLQINALTWGDINNDGHLDLVALNKIDDLSGAVLAELYLNQQDPNDNGRWKFPPVGTAFGESSSDQASPAFGDLDADGDLDLALVKNGKALILANRGGHLQGKSIGPVFVVRPSYASPSATAWGDVDGDGDLDLVIIGVISGDFTTRARLYLNQNGQLAEQPSWTDTISTQPRSLAWGDVDGDGKLDLAVGNAGQELVYLNQNGLLAATPAWTSAEADLTSSVAWGDLDADGDLDLVVGNYKDIYDPADTVAHDKIYLNQNGQLATTPAWIADVDNNTMSIALGDMDGDGDLDLAIGSAGAPNKLYRNVGLDAQGKPRLEEIWHASLANDTRSIAWGDIDGDGDLDLVTGNWGGPEMLYLNKGGSLSSDPDWRSADLDDTWAVALGDVDGDGDLDLATANEQGPVRIYLNQDGILQTAVERIWQLTPACSSSSLAWGDLDRDGDLDLALGASGSCSASLYLNPKFGPLQHPGRHPESIVVQPTSSPVQSFSGQSNSALAPANFYATPGIRSDGSVPISYTLFSPTGELMHQIRAFYSPDGGGHWHPALATNDTLTQDLATGQFPTSTLTNTHIFTWDVVGSGFFGQSDNMVVRFEAIPSVKPQRNGVAGPYQSPLVTTQTFPFRVRGAQVRVIQQDPMSNALVYRLPVGQTGIAQPIRTDTDSAPYHTDSQGYLQGRGQLVIGDRLVALAPITATESYTLYHMSATPTLNGLDVYTVTTAGVQTLTVTSAHPLLLFNLDVALEWDARKDTAFLNQLGFDLRRTAEFLFDASDGQATLGQIRLYQNKENWEGADIRIYASNALIPNADPGGIVRSEASELITANPFINATTPYSITYQPGHIRMGAIWNRFGESSGTLGEDWPRTLAHELGHYAFYLYDNYLGLQDGAVVAVDTCQNTLMADQYREDFSEFHTAATWATDCAKTISAQRSGRADWQTIKHFYPWLSAPLDKPLAGPSSLPLAVTQVQPRFATTATLPIDVALFDLVDANGKAQRTGEQAQVALYSQTQLIDLGHPVVDKLDARGAHIGDRLCVYDLGEHHLGCKIISADDNFLTLVDKPDWQPEIVVSPVSSRTVSVLVSGVAAGLTLQGKLYPENSPATPVTNFVPWANDTYSTTFQLSVGGLAGHIQLWVDEAASASNPRREAMTSYALGGSPGKIKKPAKGNRSLATPDQADSEDVAPAISPDGQVLIYGNVRFKNGEFYALQKVNWLPTPLSWATVAGDGYRILKSNGAPDLVDTSILFRYRRQDVPANEENFLSLYFWDEHDAQNKQWRKLPTLLNKTVTEASAKAQGPGLYVLMSSLEIPLQQVGWNLIAYPVQGTRPISQALASLDNHYSTVYGYVATDVADPWKVYAPSAPAWVNDLQVMEFGYGYWINATAPMTWLIKGQDTVQAANVNGVPTPPATFYGVVLAGRDLTPVAGLPVQALINGVVCGEGLTQVIDNQIVYSLNVAGDGSRNPACVGSNQLVVITVAGLPLEFVTWQNDSVQQVIINSTKVYLPIIQRGQ